MSLLDKIRQEAASPTVKVPPRIDPLEPEENDPIDLPETAPAPQSKSQVEIWESELETYPTVADKKVGVRVEQEILEELEMLCLKNKITIETLLESFYVNCKSKDNVMKQVVKEAQSRIRRRTEAGNLRSLITKAKNAAKR